MRTLVQQLVNGLSLGGTYALLALGLAIVYSVLGLINFAHGGIMTIAGYAMFFAVSAGLPFPVVALVAVASACIAALMIERVAFRPLRNAPGSSLLLSSFGVGLILEIGFIDLVSARPKAVPTPDWLGGSLRAFGINLGVTQLLSIVTCALLLLALNRFLTKSALGLGVRAAAVDFDTTRLMGIRANTVIATAFAVSGALAGAAAVLWVAVRGSVDPEMGFLPVLAAFVAVTIGGLGTLSGAVAGGFVLGLLQTLLRAYLPDALLPYRDAVAFLVVIAVLLARPSGIFSRGVETDRA